jgi:protein-disulfide isomerase
MLIRKELYMPGFRPKAVKLALFTAMLSIIAQSADSNSIQPCSHPPLHSAVSQDFGSMQEAGSGKPAITILAFSDFESFASSRLANVLKNLLDQQKQVRLIFKHAPASTNPNSFLAHEAALAAGAQGKFWEMHDVVFENQTNLSRANLLAYAKQLGVNVADFQQALDSHIYQPVIERDLAEAKALGVTTTPTLFVNGRRLVGPQGYASLGAVIESLLAGIPKDQRVQDELVATGPTRQINLKHAPTMGLESAPISVVEFSDFECPFCAQTAPLVHQLMAAYPTQIRFAFKHYPLPMHKESALAHEAALAAEAQGKFWEMHDLLFAKQDKLTREDLTEYARQLKLDIPRFISDLDAHRFKSQVDADRQEGDRLAVDGTPFFFINGHTFSGAATFPDFKRVIDEELKNVGNPQALQAAK